ncbi:MAG: hypothetical protein VCE91_11535 [Nitrospinota bacterium]
MVHSFDETFSGATLENILLRGGIGIIVDTISGAAQEYPLQGQVADGVWRLRIVKDDENKRNTERFENGTHPESNRAMWRF